MYHENIYVDNLDKLLLYEVALQVPYLHNRNHDRDAKRHDTEPCHSCICCFTHYPHICFSVYVKEKKIKKQIFHEHEKFNYIYGGKNYFQDQPRKRGVPVLEIN